MSEPKTASEKDSGDWRVEVVRRVSSLPIELLKVALNMAFITLIGWGASLKMDGHIDKIAVRDVQIKKENDATISTVTATNNATLQAISERHAKAVSDIRDGFRESSDRAERLYERLMNRPQAIGSGPRPSASKSPCPESSGER